MGKKISIQVFSNSLGDEEIKAIEPILKSRWIGMGKETELFEKEFGQTIGSKSVLAVNSCTSALFLSMHILGIGQGDEVIIPSINFIGTANAVLNVGAKPIFADVDPDTLNLLPSEIRRLRTKNTKAVLLLHYGGHPCDFDTISDAAKGLSLIEDSANSIVSQYKGRTCGTLGDLGCFSFDAMKILCVGDGGALVVNRPDLIDRAQEYRYLGIKNQKSGIDSFKAKNTKWWEIDLGRTSGRYISNDIASAIGRVQLKKLSGFIARRKEIWGRYQKELRQFDWIVRPPEPLTETTTSYYLFWIKLKAKVRDALAQHLVSKGIYCTFRYYPLHLIKQYNSTEKLKNSESLNDTVLNLPLHQNISDTDLDYIIETIKDFEQKIRQ
ncbi:MAG: DegT/DnrJ/EryC1/StrS family aminotransferase [Candidatus Omnitrophica bacterium]|nr:DegT/DnrJ/EryC1/StrS family aminotransferase [Candidatus Omnitrophota bacterium]